jgi:hypothetical protein
MNKSLIELISMISEIASPVLDEIETADISFVHGSSFRVKLTTSSDKGKRHFGKLAKKERCDTLSITYGGGDDV